MKINEVEALVGITKKNIRFYEEQGLLKPGRNSQNGYREYGEPEVELLRQIKLLRKLGVPLEEIRQMQTGSRTLGDGMRRHLVTLERERKNLDQAVQFCQALKDREVRLDSLDAGGLLREMEQMEQEGATFLDRQQGDTRRIRYVAPVVVTLLTVFLMGGLIALMLWGFSIDAEDAPPLPLLVVLVGFVVFRADSLSQALGYLGAMVAGGGSMALSAGTLSYLTPWFCCVFLIGCITSFPVVPAARRALCVGSGGTRLYTVAGYGLSLLLFALCVLSLAADTYNPFIYFRF